MDTQERDTIQIGCVLLLLWPLVILLIIGILAGWTLALLLIIVLLIGGIIYWILSPAWR